MGDHSLRCTRNQDAHEREAILNGNCAIRTAVQEEILNAEKAVLNDK